MSDGKYEIWKPAESQQLDKTGLGYIWQNTETRDVTQYAKLFNLNTMTPRQMNVTNMEETRYLLSYWGTKMGGRMRNILRVVLRRTEAELDALDSEIGH
jgi:hypothetical protein